MSILVYGAGGYIGIPVCAELLKRGYKVIACDRYFFQKEPPPGCLKRVSDIRHAGELGDHVEAVIDLAGLSNDAAGDMDNELTFEINVKGAQKLAVAAKREGVKYIYSSSASVYGSNTKLGLTEADDCKPLTVYAESKVRMEDFLRKEADNSFKPIILRNATVFGVSPRMRFDLVVNGMTRSAYVNGSIKIDGNGMQWRPFIHVLDVANEFCDALEKDGGYTRNVVSCNRRINDVAKTVAIAFEDEIVVEQNPDLVDKRTYYLRETVLNGKQISDGVKGIIAALDAEIIDPDDPTGWTVRWYKEHCQL